MEITQITVPGAGTLHDARSRTGGRFRILIKAEGGRDLYLYPSADSGDVVSIELDGDEADLVADLLHSKPIPDRMADLERRVSELAAAR